MTYIPDESKVVYKSKDAKEEEIFDALEWLAARLPFYTRHLRPQRPVG